MRCEPTLTDDYIDKLLMYLQGWVILDCPCDEVQDEYATSFLEREHIDDSLTHINKISRHELEVFFQKGIQHVKAWIWFDYIPDNPVVHEALLKWTAGLVWKKYNVKEVELMDNTNNYGYGDQLISSAKNILKPYIRTRIRSLN